MRHEYVRALDQFLGESFLSHQQLQKSGLFIRLVDALGSWKDFLAKACATSCPGRMRRSAIYESASCHDEKPSGYLRFGRAPNATYKSCRQCIADNPPTERTRLAFALDMNSIHSKHVCKAGVLRSRLDHSLSSSSSRLLTQCRHFVGLVYNTK